jgi:heme/copper-type cytochrome/quinol oxidase subunit 2
VTFLGFNIPAQSIWIFYTLGGLVGVLVLVVVGGGVWIFIRRRREAKAAEAPVETAPNP